jgi:DNA-binding NarL/FixJ family response regulator
MIRILYIEDHPATISGLRTFFRPDRENVCITQSANTLTDALPIDEDSFDVIFLDLWLEERKDNPVINIEKLRESFPRKPIVIFSGETEFYWERKCFHAGVKAFLNKTAERPRIVETVRRVMAGEIVYTAHMSEFKAKRIITGHQDPKYGLTEDQNKIIALFVEGMAPKDIAGQIKKNVSTVNRAFQAIRQKFNVTSNTDLMRALLKLEDFRAKS